MTKTWTARATVRRLTLADMGSAEMDVLFDVDNELTGSLVLRGPDIEHLVPRTLLKVTIEMVSEPTDEAWWYEKRRKPDAPVGERRRG